MSYEEYKKRMDDLGIKCYRTVIPKHKEPPMHCYKCGKLKPDYGGAHVCEEDKI